MKQLSMLGAAALLVNTALVTPAFATATETPDPQGANATTLAAMQAQCNTLAGLHPGDWTGTLDPDSIVGTIVGAPSEVANTRDIDEDTVVGVGFTPTGYSYPDPIYRIGGSVNLFGDERISGRYASSTYDYTADFVSTFSYAFDCNMVETVYPDSDGHYEIKTSLIGTPQAEAALQECNAYNNAHDSGVVQGFWGRATIGNCMFVGTTGTPYPEDRDPESGTPINQDQSDNLTGHEANGLGFDDTIDVGQVVVCISPTTTTQIKKGNPGTWTPKNNYNGASCSTTYFNSAPWGAGTNTSNGTYISVPAT